jgi:hypothetical protein
VCSAALRNWFGGCMVITPRTICGLRWQPSRDGAKPWPTGDMIRRRCRPILATATAYSPLCRAIADAV